MSRTMFFKGFGLAIALVSLAVFTACKSSDDKSDDTNTGPENTEAVLVTDIPATIGASGGASYKAFVQLSTGQDASAGYVALGAAQITGEAPVPSRSRTKPGRPGPVRETSISR